MYPEQGQALSAVRGGLSAVTGTNDAPIASSTERELIALHTSVSDVSNLLQRLHERLQPVLRPPFPQPGESATQKEESLPPIANAVRQSRYIAQNVANQLDNILSRLDI